jgi:hypothetical protein
MEFNKLESAILMVLEEAGEENVAALLNTVTKGHTRGATNEIDEFRRALSRLVSSGFLDVASLRDQGSRRWIPISKQDSLSLLRELDSVLHWLDADAMWIWSSPSPRAEVLLTAAGKVAAHELITEHGWHDAV